MSKHELLLIDAGVLQEIRVGITQVNRIWWDERTRLEDMPDQYLKNAALKLVGFGAESYSADEVTKELWLKVLQLEWERRVNSRKATLVKEKGE